MIFVDTSVIVAASHRADFRYRESNEFLSRIRRESASCGAHSLIETFAVLTGRPRPLRVPIPDALRLIEQARRLMQVVALSEAEYFDVVLESANVGRMGGIIYDALLIACARKAQAEAIYTWNVRHFRTVSPNLAARILEP